jgi:hypothetical protein
LEHPNVIAVCEDRAASREDTVHGFGESGAERLHSAPKRFSICRFHDHVRVVALKRVVNETKRATFTPPRERTLDLAHELHRPERGNIASHLDGDVRREQARGSARASGGGCEDAGRFRPAPGLRPP